MPIWTGGGAPTDFNWSTAANWDTGVPSSVSDAIFDGVTGTNPNKNCIITSGAQCRSLNCAGYAGTITFTNTLTVNMQSGAGQGDITFSAAPGFSMVGPNGISYVINVTTTTRNITTNSYNFNLPFSISGLGGSTLNLVGNFQVSNFTGANVSITGNELRVSGNWSGGAFGTALKVLNGTGTMTTTSASVTNLVINAPGFTRTFSGTVTINNSLTWIAGTLVTTGSTFELFVSTINFPTTQPLNNVSILGGTIYTMTLSSDVYVAGNLSWGNGMTINGNKFFVQGSVTSGGGSGGSMVVEMTGTGTITGIINWLLIANSPSGTITFASNAIMAGGFTYTNGTLNLTNNLQIQGPLVINNPITATGTGRLYFLNYLSANTTINVTSNGHSWPNDAEIQASGGGGNIVVTLNLIGNFTVLGNFFVSQFSTFVAAQTINNNTLFVRGNFTVTVPSGLNGTANIVLEGSSNSGLSATFIQNNLTINKSGGATVTTTGTVGWGLAGRTFNIITGNNLVLSNALRVAGGTFTAVGIVTGSANLELAGTCTLDITTGVTIPNLRANSATAITVTLSRTTVVTNFSKTGSAALTDCTFSASTAGTELRITNYTTHTFNLGATLMGTNTTLRFMGPSCTFDSFNIGGNVVLDTGATLTALATSTLFTTIRFAANTTLNFSGGTLVLPAITNSNKLGTGFTFNAGTAHTINMGSNSIDWIVCNNGPTVTLQANLVINKAINQGISSPTFTGGFNLIVKESLATSSNANWYGLNISGGGKIVYQSSATGFIGTGYISGTTLFITSVIQGTLGYYSIIHVPSSSTTSYTQIDNCTTFPTAGTGQYTVQTSMTVGSVGSPVTIYGFGIGFMGTNGLVEIDAGSNAVYLHAISLPSTTSELRYLSTNSGIFDGSKAWVLNSFGSTESTIDFQGQSSTTKFINRFSPGYNVGGQINLKSNLYVNDLECLNSSGVGQIGGPYTLYVLRNFSVGNSGSTRVLAPNVRLEGPLNANFTCNSLFGNVEIAKSGAAIVTVTQSFTYGYATATTFTYTAGLVNFGATTMTIAGNCTIISPSSVGNFSFNNVTINNGITLTLQNTMRILGILLCNGNSTFAGTHGWTANTFTCLATGSTITLQNSNASPNAIYYISTALNLTGASSASRILLQASDSATFNARAGSPSANSLQYVSGTIPSVGMTVSQATGQSPVGFSNLLPTRPVINGGTSPNFTLDQTIVPSVPNPPTGTISMRAGYKAIFTLQSGAFQNVAYVTTQDIDSLSNSGATILSFGSNNDDVATNVFLYRTLNWGPLVASSGSAYKTWVD